MLLFFLLFWIPSGKPFLLLGAVGAILRSIELVRYIEPSTNLYHASGLMAWALPLVSAAAIAVSVVVGKKTSRGQTGSFCEVFAFTSSIFCAGDERPDPCS